MYNLSHLNKVIRVLRITWIFLRLAASISSLSKALDIGEGQYNFLQFDFRQTFDSENKWYTSSITLRALHFVHYTSCITLRALHFVHYTSCITLRASQIEHYTSSITLWALHFEHYTSSITLRALHFEPSMSHVTILENLKNIYFAIDWKN